MVTLAKTRTAGMTAATALSAFGFAAATNPAALAYDECGTCHGPAIVLNEQDFSGGKSFTGELDVVVENVTDTAANAGALGNSYTAITKDRNLQITSTQTLDANGSARAMLNATSAGNALVTASTYANGTNLVARNARIDAVVDQFAQGEFSSDAIVRGGDYGTLTANAATVGNATSMETRVGEMAGTITQELRGSAAAETNVDVASLSGPTLLGVETVGNALTTHPKYVGGGQFLVDQINSASAVTGSTLLTTGSADQVVATTSVTANSVSADHASGYIQVDGQQQSSAFVRGETVVFIDELEDFADASSVASGNLLAASTTKSDGRVDFVQLNTGGGVEAVSTLVASGGAMSTLNSTAQAFGNALTASGCSDCNVRMDGVSRQSNSSNVVARATISGTGGNVYGSAVAVGNSATYQVTSPGH